MALSLFVSGYVCSIAVGIIFGVAGAGANEAKETLAWLEEAEIPVAKLIEGRLWVSAFKYLGLWRAISEANGRIPWKNTVQLNRENGRVSISLSTQKAEAAGPVPALLTPDNEGAYNNNFGSSLF